MKQVSIFSTDHNAAEYPEFEHQGTLYRFVHLGPCGPTHLVEGRGWFFVDWLISELSGLEMCRRLRADQRTAKGHITMVLERDDMDDRRRSLAAGADDYAVGPLDRNAMLDRVLALQSGPAGRDPRQALCLGVLRLDRAAEQARFDGTPVPLRPNEFRLLRYMMENPDRILTRQELVDALEKSGDPEYLRTVDVWIKRLRFSLKEVGAQHLLRTVRAKGYVLDSPEN